jgi:hypothetical protein
MNKLGLIFDFVGFAMLFWRSYGRAARSLKNGGGITTDLASERHQLEKVLAWIPCQKLRRLLIAFWQPIAFALIATGVLIQLLSS